LRKFILIIILFSRASFIITGQVVHPDLGLHGQVTWLSDTKIRVEYDWSDDTQLSDWTTTNGSSLVRGNGLLTIREGAESVRSMIWKQLMKCTNYQRGCRICKVNDLETIDEMHPDLCSGCQSNKLL